MSAFSFGKHCADEVDLGPSAGFSAAPSAGDFPEVPGSEKLGRDDREEDISRVGKLADCRRSRRAGDIARCANRRGDGAKLGTRRRRYPRTSVSFANSGGQRSRIGNMLDTPRLTCITVGGSLKTPQA